MHTRYGYKSSVRTTIKRKENNLTFLSIASLSSPTLRGTSTRWYKSSSISTLDTKPANPFRFFVFPREWECNPIQIQRHYGAWGVRVRYNYMFTYNMRHEEVGTSVTGLPFLYHADQFDARYQGMLWLLLRTTTCWMSSLMLEWSGALIFCFGLDI